MLIKGLQKQTLIDFPGKVACTIFLFGCNFRCPYCHNPELIDAEKAAEIRTYSKKEILDFLEERKGFLEGVCITGGEPTLNKDLPEFLEEIKKLGYKIKLDTNGTNPEMLELILRKKLADYIAMDFKAPFSKYSQATNSKVDLKNIEKSIETIRDFPDYEFRITAVPELTGKDDLIWIAEYLKEHRANRKFFIQGFRKDKCLEEKFEKKHQYSGEQITELLNAIKQYFTIAGIRNETY
ncbi:MAG: anaerobic ribonucleoside-triphosphate reductase activating protein [archaeon]